MNVEEVIIIGGGLVDWLLLSLLKKWEYSP